jgi:peptidoglycan-associated lipoprotein
MNTSGFARLAVPVAGASLLLQMAGCSPRPVQTSVFSPAQATPPPAPPLVVVSPHLSVSEELAAACNLDFNDIGSAPKFDFDGSTLVAQDDDVLSRIAKCVITGPMAGRALQLVGRADPRGEGDYNMALGQRRATSVQVYLSGLGVDGSKLALSSRGNVDATGIDESGWQRDRRVDILLH